MNTYLNFSKTKIYWITIFVIVLGISRDIRNLRLFQNKGFLSIVISKNEPPSIAFKALHFSLNKNNEWANLKKKSGYFLESGTSKSLTKTRNIEIPTLTISRESNDYYFETPLEEIVKDLPQHQAHRLITVNEKFGILKENWSTPSTRELIQNQLPKHIRQISGRIELKGLPPPNGKDWELSIARYFEGEKLEEGYFNVKDSSYSIPIQEFEGTLIAKLFDKNSGTTIGEGKLSLSEYRANGNSQIPIREQRNQLDVGIYDYYNPNKKNNIASEISYKANSRENFNPETLIASLDMPNPNPSNTRTVLDNIQKGSWTVIRSRHPGFVESIVLSRAGDQTEVPLFPEKMISALKEIARDSELTSRRERTDSIIWGKVVQGSKPLSSATVSLIGNPDLKVIYFNSLMIPDNNLQSTSENGMFAIMDAPPGIQTVEANIGAINVSIANTFVDDGAVSPVQLESSLERKTVVVKAFDAFTGVPTSANVDLQSLNQELSVAGQIAIKSSDLSRLMFGEVTPINEEFIPFTAVYDESDTEIHLPMVSKQWIEKLYLEKKINLVPGAHIAIGFVRKWKFQVYLGQNSNYPRENIVYFDSEGSVTQNPSQGGGFVLFNIPTNGQTIVIADENSPLIETKIIPADSGRVSVLTFN